MDDQRVVVEIVKFVDLNNHDQQSSESLVMTDDEAVLQESVIVLKSDGVAMPKAEGFFHANENDKRVLEKSSSYVVDVKLDTKDDGDSIGSVYWDVDDQTVVIEKEKSFDSKNLGRESSGSSSTGDDQQVVLESEIVEGSDGGAKSEVTLECNEKEKAVLEQDVADRNELKDDKSSSCVVDVVCRICHLSSDQTPERCNSSDADFSLVPLGCDCKDELGVAHFHCAQTWFKLKGNRICEICGEAARNITGIIHEPRPVEWNEQRSFGSSASYAREMSSGLWRGQPCCNFLMACLIAAFVLPWFFRVNIF